MKANRTVGILFACLLTSSLSISVAHAVPTTRYVAATGTAGAGTSCSDPGYIGGSSIATALSASADGDTIILCNGTFTVSSQIAISNKEITISGQTSAANTVIDGSTSNNGVFSIISTKSVKIEKITFSKAHSTGYGGAINLSLKPSESLSTTRHVITNNIFVQNVADDQGGSIFGGGDNMGTGDFQGILTISNNTFIENYAAVDGGAIVMAAVAFDETRIVISSNKFLYNRAGARAGGAVVSNFNTLTTSENIFYLNTTGDTGNSETLYGRIKMGGDIIMNNLSAGRRDCRLEDLSPTVASTTRVDNPYCLFFNDSQVSGLTTITRAQGLALTGTFVPQSPQIASSSPTSSSVDLTLASRDSGGANITQYSYSLNGGSYVNFPAGNSSTQTISGLSSNTSYNVRLKATSTAGTSYESALHSFTTSAAPADAPIITNLSAGDRSLTINFTLGGDNGNPVTDVHYSLSGGSFVSSGSTTSPITVVSLSGRTTYSVKIKSENSAGFSSDSNLRTATTTDSSQDASDAAAAKERQRQADLQRERKMADARARVLADVRNNKEPSKMDLQEANYPNVIESNINRLAENIPLFARGESTTAQDILTAAKSVYVLHSFSDNQSAKLVKASDLTSIGIEAFTSKFKNQILRGLFNVPADQRDTILELKAASDKILNTLQERRDKVRALAARNKN